MQCTARDPFVDALDWNQWIKCLIFRGENSRSLTVHRDGDLMNRDAHCFVI